jgi:hypothetical protein
MAMTKASWENLKNDMTAVVAVFALVISAVSFYVSYFYTKQQLEVTVTDVSFITNQGEVYVTVAFSNGGNRDAALLRAEPAIWAQRPGKPKPEWIPLTTRIHANVPLSDPKVPAVIRSGGVEVVSLAARLTSDEAERAVVATQNGAFLGVIVETMNSDGNLYLVQHPVARLDVDANGRIRGAEPTIHRSLGGFTNLETTPPGDQLQQNEKTPFVWADQHN